MRDYGLVWTTVAKLGDESVGWKVDVKVCERADLMVYV